MSSQPTVWDATYDLLRTLGLTTVFGNPGSTEQTFLKNFPDDFTYVLGLQEASVLAMADGFAQSTGEPALVNLHTAAGTGNAMGSLIAAYKSNTPLIVTAGQQTREMILSEPYLTNTSESLLPLPWVKWAYQPARAEDVPAAFMRAYTVAVQPPAGPVYLSIPLDDWDKPALGPAVVRSASRRSAPDASRLGEFADRINRARRPLLVFGPEVDRAGAWGAAIAVAEKVHAPVYASALPDRVSFPEDHPLYQGMLPMTIAEVNAVLRGHDLAIVVGAQVFRYYPYVAGDHLPAGTELLHITADPWLAGAAPVGDSLLGDTLLALRQLDPLIESKSDRPTPTPLDRGPGTVEAASAPLTPAQVYSALSTVKPAEAALVNESTSTMAEQARWLPTLQTHSFFATGSGGIGWGVPGAVGVALGDRARGRKRAVVATIGDGSFQYSIQAIWTAARHKLPIVFVVMRNGEYSVLKSFALLEKTPGVPGLDLPGLDIQSLATGFGCRAVTVGGTEELVKEFEAALGANGPTVIVVPTKPQLAHLG
ncbi:benzoylformate decarboxylase [Mycobacterium scrofulaceum]|uniref:acetolactate synthase n=1 Tax=Mycobacterium scrofulaceum TaxID=1783 RepID=A0A1X0KJ65_MYCSC|nr:benzoylformate decarboxylase [Mycobacterium scrofulaceum]ORB75145.1 benzoylformate decarboxylase [Mycobacterium scrofulaceum]